MCDKDNFMSPGKTETSFKPRQVPVKEQRGRIELIMGCMFAGKTTELLRRCRKHQICGKRVFRLKFVSDVRYGNEGAISTHTGDRMDALTVKTLADAGDQWKDYDVIGVDEGQFFTDLVPFSEMAANAGKVVIISSLQGTFLRGPFPDILSLIPKCEKVKKLSAICKMCKDKASFTFRTASGDNDKLIGGEDMYMPLCRACHARESKL
jgi:thymidine kinase